MICCTATSERAIGVIVGIQLHLSQERKALHKFTQLTFSTNDNIQYKVVKKKSLKHSDIIIILLTGIVGSLEFFRQLRKDRF